jgi:hypothetical protein
MSYDTDIEAVRDEIIAAFRDVPMPSAGELLGPSRGELDVASEKRVRKALLGKHYTELGKNLLDEYKFYFCYLSAEAYRHYLPALLLSALSTLDGTGIDRGFAHSVTFSLPPSYWALYYEGEDELFNYQTSLFTSEQIGAVCSFLGLIFTYDVPLCRHLSAQALRWGWDRIEHPALDEVSAYFHNLHHFEYPPAQDPEVIQLIDLIRTAFADTPYPGDDDLCGSEMGDEPSECALEFLGLDWRTIHPALLAENYASLSFLSDNAYRYFLPAYLIADIHDAPEVRQYQEVSTAEPVFHLTITFYPNDKAYNQEFIESFKSMGTVDDETLAALEEDLSDKRHEEMKEHTLDRHSGFSKPERQAIIAYLRYRATRSDMLDYRIKEIEDALDSYWLKTI